MFLPHPGSPESHAPLLLGEERVGQELGASAVFGVPLPCLGFSCSRVPQLWMGWGVRVVSPSVNEGMRLQFPLLLLPGSCVCGLHCGRGMGVMSIASPDATGFSGVAGLATVAEGQGS